MANGLTVKNDDIAIWGESRTGQFVYAPPHNVGVYGRSDFGPAVKGESVAEIGVLGHSFFGAGVLANSYLGTGLDAYSEWGSGVRAHSNNDNPGGSPGVYGTAATGPGIWGNTTQGSGVGVLGQSIAAPGVRGTSERGAGVFGDSSSGASPGVFGIGSPGGLFIGGLISMGTLTAIGGLITVGPKSAAVRSRDGSHRLLYCVESPESWFEDFGRARLVRGKAEVRLDATFAAMVRTDDYHIFLSPEGNCAGLYVSRRTRAGFQVREQGHGTSTVAFSYRIVARRKDIEAPRFAKLPKHLDPSHLKKTLKAFKPPKSPKPLKPFKPPTLPKLPETLRVPAPPQVPRPKQRRSAGGPGARSKWMRESTRRRLRPSRG